MVGGFLRRGQHNFAVPAAKGRYPGRPDAKDAARVRDSALAVAEHVSTGRPGPVPESRQDALEHGRGFYDFLGLAATYRVIRLMLPETRIDDAKCDRCGWCVQACPADNIALEPQPVLDGDCIRCYRCLSGCPRDVFDATWWYANLGHLALNNSVLGRWFGDLEKGERVY